ncbi:ankyrin repeat domain-containing protein 10-like isoform X1 [Littorina saxatilis]|uniref:Ankyrin repeat domain-containing protein 10 n=1 Tax=Littorina saxatilis TaxID=31220 RepID=A0AAN9B0L8_9CAEN
MYRAAMANNIDEMTEELLRNHYPLHHACMVGDERRVGELLSNGCFDVYQEDGCRAWTPMHWAAFSGHWECLAVLKEKCGVGMDVPNERFNQTPAHIAAQGCQTDCSAWLVQHGARLGAQDHLGDTPLHKAARLGNIDCIKILTSHGPALSIFNQSGQTPLDIAAVNGHLECKAFLEQAASSQHSSFFPSSSSPILMNGEGIYQRQKLPSIGSLAAEHGSDQDMEMGEEMAAGGGGDASAIWARAPALKRSFDDEEDSCMKRQRLFEPICMEKLGTATNNNVLSSYNAILAMSAEPNKTMATHNTNCMEQVHAMRQRLPIPCLPLPSMWTPAVADPTPSSSYQEHCNSLRAQRGYDTVMVQSLINTDHGT